MKNTDIRNYLYSNDFEEKLHEILDPLLAAPMGFYPNRSNELRIGHLDNHSQGYIFWQLLRELRGGLNGEREATNSRTME